MTNNTPTPYGIIPRRRRSSTTTLTITKHLSEVIKPHLFSTMRLMGNGKGGMYVLLSELLGSVKCRAWLKCCLGDIDLAFFFFFLPRQIEPVTNFYFFFALLSSFSFFFISLLLLKITNKISIQRLQIPMICRNRRQCFQNSQYHHLRHLPPSYQPFQLILLQNPQPRNWPYHWSHPLSQRLLWFRIWMLLHLW
jgi:hypothetical protein